MVTEPDGTDGDGVVPDLDPARRIDLLCDEFEESLRAGRAQRVEVYLGRLPAEHREALLSELLGVAIYWHRRANGGRDLEGLLSRFPDHEGVVRRLWDAAERDDGMLRVASQRYRIVEQLARGGGGIVYRAWDESLGRMVVLKEILQGHAGTSRAVARFENEARITSRLEHPGVPPVFAAGRHGPDRPYFVTRHVPGRTLREALERFHEEHDGRDSAGWLVALRPLLRRFLEACEVLRHAHTRGVIHRDLKPANILLGEHGETIVIDWGIARAADTQESRGGPAAWEGEDAPSAQGPLTLEGDMLGTPGYAAPEQYEPHAREATFATDVYGLGATLYHLLAGRPSLPVSGEEPSEISAERLEQMAGLARAGAITPPRAVRPQVPKPLDAICRRAMRPDPGDRYPTVAALADDVANWLDGASVSAWPDPPWARVRRWCRRRRAASGAIAALAVILTVALGWAAIERVRAETRVSSWLAAIRVSDIGDIPATADLLEREPELALRALDAELRKQVNNLDYSTKLQLAALALDPNRTTDLSSRLRSDRAFGRSLVLHIAALGRSDPPRQAAFLKLLRPLREPLLPYLLDTLRRFLLPSDALDAEDRARLSDVLLAYAADRPSIVAEASLHVPDRSYPRFIERMKVHPREVLAELDRLEPKVRPVWSNEVEIREMPAPDAAVVAEIQATRGMVTELFAFTPILEVERLVPVVEALRPSGYRPIRVRPVEDAAGHHVSIVWTRDELAWELLLADSPRAIRERQEVNAARDWQAVEVSCHERASSSGGRRVHFVGIWAERLDRWKRIASGSVRTVANLVWSAWPIISEDADYATRVVVDLTPEAAAEFAASLVPTDWQLRTCHDFIGRDGVRRLNQTWDNRGRWGPVKTVSDADETALDAMLDPFDMALVPTDLSIRRDGAALRFTTATFYRQPFFDFHVEKHVPVDTLAQRAAVMAGAGFKPLSLCVVRGESGLVATTLWHAPSYPRTDVAEWEMRLRARPLAIRFHLGEEQALWDALREDAEPNVRAYLLENLAPLGVPVERLLARFADETETSLRARLLQALRNYDRAGIAHTPMASFAAELRRVAETTPNETLRREALWILDEWGRRRPPAVHRDHPAPK